MERKKIFFITGNPNKYREVAAILDVEQLNVDLPEIQHTDPREIVRYKLEEARKHNAGEFIVEDTGLYFECLNGLPGPLIKWFLEAVGNEGLAKMAQKLGNNRAYAKTTVGYSDLNGNAHFFEGIIVGRIVSPRGNQRFGWDSIFEPEGSNKTFAEMSPSEKNKVSMRRIALDRLKAFLESR